MFLPEGYLIRDYFLYQELQCFLLWSIIVIRNFREKKIHLHTSYSDIFSIIFLLTTGFLLLHLSHFTDVVILNNGIKFRNIFFAETNFHLGLVNSLRNIQPTIYPYASGVGFSFYHINMHLQIEMFNRYFSLDTVRLTFFYFPLLYFCLLMFLPFIFIRKYDRTGLIAVLAGVSMFAADFSFVPGLLGVYPADYPWANVLPYPWTLFFQTSIWSLLCLNGLLPSIFTLSLCVIYLRRYYDTGSAAVLAMFFVLAYASFGYKSSMGVHIAGTALLTGIVLMFREDKYKGRLIIALSIVTLIVMAGDILFIRGGTGNAIVRVVLLNGFERSLANVRLSGIPTLFYPIMFILYMLFTFGVRSLGFCFIKDFITGRLKDPVIVFLLIFSISGFLVSEIIYIGDPLFIENNGVWFSVQSLFGASLLLFLYLVRLQNNKEKLFMLAAVVLLSFPSTLQFLTLRYDNHYYLVDSNAIEVVNYLEKTPPDSVILHPNVNGGPSLASNLAGRWSVFSSLHSHIAEHIGQREAATREKDIYLFFDFKNDMDRCAILKKYNVDYVYAPLEYDIGLVKELMLGKVFINKEYAVYKVDHSKSCPQILKKEK